MTTTPTVGVVEPPVAEGGCVRSIQDQPSRRSARATVAVPLVGYALGRALVLATAVVVTAQVNRQPQRGPWPRVPGPYVSWLQALGRWDGAWYLDVAHYGYRRVYYHDASHASMAFFPGFPLLTRMTASLSGLPQLVVAVALGTALGAAFAVIVWVLVRDIAGLDAARRATLLVCFAPGAFVFSMAYSEALFLTAVAASLLFLVRRNWVTAGLCGAIATASRPNGAALLLTCAVVAALAIRRHRDWRALFAPVLTAAGAVGYFVFLFVRTGDVTAWFDVQRDGWGDRIAPVAALISHARGLLDHGVSVDSGGLNDIVWFAGVAFAILGVVLLVRWRPPAPVLVYGCAATAFAFSSYQVGFRPRMWLSAFPLIVAIGVSARGRTFRVAMTVSVLALVAVSALTFGTLALTP